jgi:hypothetical protein
MVEAVQTTQSTLGIWVIVAVAMISLAVWLVGVYVADSYQTRLSRLWQRARAAGPAVGEAGASAVTIPGQRSDAGQPAAPPEPAHEPEPVAAPRGRHARPWERHTGDAAEPAAVRTDYLQTDFRRDGPLTKVETEIERNAPTRADIPAQADAPTRPDLPAQPAQGATAIQPATGRHAMPSQRSGETDRAERSYAGPDADREDDDDQR